MRHQVSGLWYRMTLSARVVVASLAVVASVLVISGVARFVETRQLLRDDLDEYGASLSAMLAMHSADELSAHRESELDAYVERLVSRQVTVGTVIVTSADGRPVAAAVDPLLDADTTQSLRAYTAPIRDGGEAGPRIGSVTVQLSPHVGDAMLRGRLRRMVAEIGFSLLALAACVGMLLKSSVGGPLRQLGEQASRLAAGDLESPITMPGQNEFARLAEILDAMRLRVRDQIGRLQDVTDELGREIVDRTRAEAALRERAARLARLHELNTLIVTSFVGDEIESIIQETLERTGRFLGASRIGLHRIREQRVLVRTHEWCEEAVASGGKQQREVDPEERAEWERTLMSGQPVVLGGGAAPSSLSALRTSRMASAVVVPVFIRGVLEGMMVCEDASAQREWRDEELTLLQTLVESCSRAVEQRVARRERQAASARLRKALDQAKSANQHKSEFLARMSHDLRTPMTAILGYADLLTRARENPEQVSEWAGAIQANGDHLLSLLSDILDLSKIEAGQMPLNVEPCSPVGLIQDVAELMRPRAAEKMLELRVHCTGTVPLRISSDPLRLRQILTNLVSNAIKFTDDGGVEIRTRLTSAEDDGRCRLSIEVEDTGIGIEPRALPHIFEPFSQVHSRTDGHRGGTGLGLDISRRLAAMLGGTIAVRSKPGCGSLFRLMLDVGPAASLELVEASAVRSPGAPPAPGEPSGHGASLAGRRVLVVDDNPDNQRIIAFLLEETGADVAVASDGRQALDMFDAAPRPFDLVLMDMQMPVMDGYDATAALRDRGTKAPIIALTAHAMTGDRERCISVGCNEYVSKPIVPESFFAAIERQLPTHAVRRPSPPGSPSNLAERPGFASLVNEYVAAMPALADDMERALKQRDERIGVLLHRLKGTAANYGFPELTDSARIAESIFRDEGCVDRLEEAAARVIDQLRSVPRTRRSA